MAAAAAAASAASAAPASTAAQFVEFLNEAVSPYHAVAATEARLVAAGFVRLSEREAEWAVVPGGKYYVVRNQSAVLAFAVGGKWAPGGGFSVAGAHTDSPCLRVKPVSALTKAGYLSVGVETYGGGLWYTWLDRDLSVAGRAVVATGPGTYESRLVRVRKAIARVPSLAIHLNREVNSDGLKLNAESHLPPMLATALKAQLGGGGKPAAPAAGAGAVADAPAAARHHSGLVEALAAELGVGAGDVHDFDLCLYDTQPAAIGGLADEFIFGGRLDNLMMTYTAFAGLIASCAKDTPTPAAAGSAGAATGGGAVPLADDTTIRIAAAYDHEEVGSDSVPGAGGSFLEDVLARLYPTPAVLAAAVRKSVLVSADMAHAVHPNYPEKHAEHLRPELHKGIVIKENSNQRYATTPVTSFMFRHIAAEAGVPVQWFTNRQDAGCGSTIGPIVATRLGVRTVDVGVPQLSMHSIREVCGTDDAAHAAAFFTYFYGRFAAYDAALTSAD